jgi:hypothetical protein
MVARPTAHGSGHGCSQAIFSLLHFFFSLSHFDLVMIVLTSHFHFLHLF